MMNEVGGTLLPGSLPGGCPPDPHWKFPLLVAVLLHVAVAAMAMLAPALSPRRAVLPEIHTVNLFSAIEASQPAPAVKPAAPARKEPASVPPAPNEVRTMESTPVKKEVAPSQAAAKEPPVSERPIRSKTPSDEAKLRDLRAKMTAQDAREKQKAAEREIEKALADIRNLHKNEVTAPPIQPSPPPPVPTTRPTATGGVEGSQTAAAGSSAGGGQGVIVEKIMRRYLADLHMRIQQHWKLPDLQSWDNSLEARFVIKVRRDGIVTESFFEKRSQNFHFDQFVEKAIRDASPLPPFPSGLDEERLEIGLRFRPGEVF
jgi:colicin import membrane protein